MSLKYGPASAPTTPDGVHDGGHGRIGHDAAGWLTNYHIPWHCMCSQFKLHKNVQRFRGGLVFKAHRLVYHSTLDLRVIEKKINTNPQTSNPKP